MQHAGQFEIVHEGLRARAFAGNVGAGKRLADDGIVRRVLQRDFRVDLERQTLSTDQVVNGDARASGFRTHLARREDQLGSGAIQLSCRERDQVFARRRRSLPNARRRPVSVRNCRPFGPGPA